jgi:hypothetical protein
MKTIYLALFIYLCVGTACEKANLDDTPGVNVEPTVSMPLNDTVNSNVKLSPHDKEMIHRIDSLLMAPQSDGSATVRYGDIRG